MDSETVRYIWTIQGKRIPVNVLASTTTVTKTNYSSVSVTEVTIVNDSFQTRLAMQLDELSLTRIPLLDRLCKATVNLAEAGCIREIILLDKGSMYQVFLCGYLFSELWKMRKVDFNKYKRYVTQRTVSVPNWRIHGF